MIIIAQKSTAERIVYMTLKELREKNELTQAAFAKALGVSTSLISSIESGAKQITDKVADKVLEVYDVVIETAEKAEGKVESAKGSLEKKRSKVRKAAEKVKAKVTSTAKDASALAEEAFGTTEEAAKPSSMNKTELISKVAAENKLTQKLTAAAVDTILSTIIDTVAAGESVSLPGFGTFSVKHREARQGRNPATGEAMEIAAKDVPVFKAAKAFKEKVN